MNNQSNAILFVVFFLISIFAYTFCVKGLIEKKKLEERDTRGKIEKTLFAILDVVITNVTTAFLIYSEKNVPMLVLLCMIALLAGMIFIMDIRVKIIPNVCLYPILLLALVRYIMMKDFVGIGTGFVSMFFTCYGLLALTSILGFNGYFGEGDMKLLSVGVFLFGIGRNIVGFVAGWTISYFVIAGVLLLLKKVSRKSLIAYGPYVSIGILTGLCGMYI